MSIAELIILVIAFVIVWNLLKYFVVETIVLKRKLKKLQSLLENSFTIPMTSTTKKTMGIPTSSRVLPALSGIMGKNLSNIRNLINNASMKSTNIVKIIFASIYHIIYRGNRHRQSK
jgi:hypothetical protein